MIVQLGTVQLKQQIWVKDPYVRVHTEANKARTHFASLLQFEERIVFWCSYVAGLLACLNAFLSTSVILTFSREVCASFWKTATTQLLLLSVYLAALSRRCMALLMHSLGIVSKQMTQPLRVWKNLNFSSCARSMSTVLVSLGCWIGILVQRVDEGKKLLAVLCVA